MVGACESCGRMVLKFCLNPDCPESKDAIEKQKRKAKKAPKRVRLEPTVTKRKRKRAAGRKINPPSAPGV